MDIDTQGSCHFACSLTSFSLRNSAEFCSAKQTIRRPKVPPAAWRPEAIASLRLSYATELGQ